MKIYGAISVILITAVCAVSGGAVLQIDSDVRADVSPRGAWTVTSAGTIVVKSLGIGVWDEAEDFTSQKDFGTAEIRFRDGRYHVEGDLEDRLPFEADVSRCGRGIHFRWSQTGSARNTWAVVLRIPRKLFAGVDFILDGRNAGTFPAVVPDNSRIFNGNAESLLTARTNGIRLFVDCVEQYGFVVQDARMWGDDSYHILIYPKKGEVSFFLSLSSAAGGPEILSVSQSGRSVKRFEKFELTSTVWAKYADPYDEQDIKITAEFSPPSGGTIRVDGFIYEEYLRTVEDGRERFAFAGRPVWKIRFSPAETGRYTYSVTVRTRRGTSTPVKGEFATVDSMRPGFVRVGKTGSHFEFTDGRPYFAVGHNVCWTTEDAPLSGYESYFAKMSRAGENFSRIWLCSWGIGLETEDLHTFDLEDAWKMDYILTLAEKHGIYLKLCLENFWDFTKEKKSPYWTEHGGFCREGRDFFAKAEARNWTKRKYRYAVSRWGYSPNILAWELWNEMDYALADKDLAMEWTREMAVFLRSVDPNPRMITTSLGMNNVWPELWKMPELDFVQIHSYIRRLGSVFTRSELDAAAYVRHEIARVDDFGKPYLLSEFGYLVTKDDPGMNAVDKTGIHLHNALWSSALSGAAGTCMLWWWDTYIEKNNLYYHFESLTKFLRHEEGRMMSLEPVAGEGKNFRVLGLRDDEGGLFWIQNKNNTWYRCAAQGARMKSLKGVVLKLSNLVPGRYAVEWWNTYDGSIITEFETDVPRGILKARPPAAASDIACKVKRLR